MTTRCLFCLDTVSEETAGKKPDHFFCSCRYDTHKLCIQTWFEHKGNYECPICHTIYNQMPVSIPVVLRPVVVVTPEDEQYSFRNPRTRIVVAIMCVSLFFFLGLLIHWGLRL